MKKLSKIKLQNAVVLENSEMKAIYGGSGGAGGSGGTGGSGGSGGVESPYCYDGELLYTCVTVGESGATFTGVACATSPDDAVERIKEAHGTEGYVSVTCS
ncbi:TIGR04149 family rSAM-modified RiPP [Proteiniphilum sp.]|uniref:TIGR04149 family rSAM-modified RiPP n=1 Tax=Proteiniphilum sp. TaxID=1926877 RepID=UPI002B20B9D1|nr:TIGR04149 family rSAM-modified RiPP [Proteiniphilum sp.]MEA4918957.1 TIGR04149 family rSAM-modified RiPP [Proteiniphilum sp.]